MKTLLLTISFSLISFAAPLTVAELDIVRQRAALLITVTYLKAQANTSAQAAQAWIETNRGSLPNEVTVANLTAPQRTVVQTAMGIVLTAADKIAVFNAVGVFHKITPPLPPDVLAPQAVVVLDSLLNTFSAQLDISKPGMTRAEKLRALKLALESL